MVCKKNMKIGPPKGKTSRLIYGRTADAVVVRILVNN
jgi:hypothetical protein